MTKFNKSFLVPTTNFKRLNRTFTHIVKTLHAYSECYFSHAFFQLQWKILIGTFFVYLKLNFIKENLLLKVTTVQYYCTKFSRKSIKLWNSYTQKVKNYGGIQPHLNSKMSFCSEIHNSLKKSQSINI